LIPSPVDFIGFDDFDIWGNSVFGTEFEAFFSIFNSTDRGSGDRLSLEKKRNLGESVRLSGQTKLNDDSIGSEKWHVVSELMVGTDRVQD
jgi:hypothetical protein